MDERKHLILLKGKNRTKDIRFIRRSEQGNGYEVTFFTGNPYTYKADSVVWFQEPAVKNPQLYRIRANGRPLDKIDGIFVFGEGEAYWHIVCVNGFAHTWKREELQIETSCLEQKTLKDRFAYLTDLARVSELKGDDGDALLYNQYKKADFIAEGTALPGYLYPDVNPRKTYPAQSLIFPFGGNASQFLAVERAMNNQLSVIQGPPGTGKTQTILNIIANLLIRGQTVQVVSNNNSATQNVLEKLSSPKYRMDFLVAALGKRENKAAFVKNQTGRYPDISDWRLEREYMAQLQQKINAYSTELRTHFSEQERLAVARQELSELEVERGHFEQFCADQHAAKPRKQPRKEIASKKVLGLLQECEGFCERNEKVSVWHKFKTSLFYGVFEWKFYKGGKLRRIYIPKALQDEALSWLAGKHQESGFIFLNKYGERITTRGISGQLKKLAVRYDINPAVVYPHSFRHRFAKSFLDRCNDIAFLADLMGHESIETTRIYLRKTSTEQRAIVDQVVDW